MTSVSQLRTALSFLPEPEPEADKPAPEPSVRFGQGADGMWRAVIELFPEDGELLAKALEAGRDEVFRDSHPEVEGDPDPARCARKPAGSTGSCGPPTAPSTPSIPPPGMGAPPRTATRSMFTCTPKPGGALAPGTIHL